MQKASACQPPLEWNNFHYQQCHECDPTVHWRLFTKSHHNPFWPLPPTAFCQGRIPVNFPWFLVIKKCSGLCRKRECRNIDPDLKSILEALQLICELDHLAHVALQRLLRIVSQFLVHPRWQKCIIARSYLQSWYGNGKIYCIDLI